MSTNDIHGIESGWSVKTRDGENIGSVEETTDRYILVKSGLINTDQRYLPAATLSHVRRELREIEVSLTSEEIEAGDWSEEPVEGPRSEGAPLNEDVYEDDGGLTTKPIPEPERPPAV